jgi:transcription initiation factor IIE alpha subunit
MSRILNVDDLYITGPEWQIKHVLTVADCDRAEGALIDVLAKIDRDMASERFANELEWKRNIVRIRALRSAALDHIRLRRDALRQDYDTVWNATALQVLKDIDPIAFSHVEAATNELLGQTLTQKAA